MMCKLIVLWTVNRQEIIFLRILRTGLTYLDMLPSIFKILIMFSTLKFYTVRRLVFERFFVLHLKLHFMCNKVKLYKKQVKIQNITKIIDICIKSLLLRILNQIHSSVFRNAILKPHWITSIPPDIFRKPTVFRWFQGK